MELAGEGVKLEVVRGRWLELAMGVVVRVGWGDGYIWQGGLGRGG